MPGLKLGLGLNLSGRNVPLTFSGSNALVGLFSSLPFTMNGGDQITVSDSADTGGADYTLQLTISDGTLTLFQTTGLAFSVGDGTADATMTFDGTITNINAALDGATIQSIAAAGEETISVTFTNNVTGGQRTKTIYVLPLPALTTTAISDDTAIGTPIETFGGALTGTSAVVSIVSSSQTSRPLVSGLLTSAVLENGFDIDFNVQMLDSATGDFWVFVSTSATPPSVAEHKAGTGASYHNGALGTAIADNGTTVTAVSTISATGLTASTTYYVHVLIEDDNATRSQQVTSASVTTDVSSGVTQTSTLSEVSTTGTVSTTDATNDSLTSGNNQWASAHGSVSKTSGKRYFEVVYNEGGVHNHNSGAWGLIRPDNVTGTISATAWAAGYGTNWTRPAILPSSGDGSSSAEQNDTTNDWTDNSVTLTALRHAGGGDAIFALATDLDTGEVWVGYDNGSSITWFGDPVAGTGESFTDYSAGENTAPLVSVYDDSNEMRLRTGSNTCTYSPPTGFVYWDAT